MKLTEAILDTLIENGNDAAQTNLGKLSLVIALVLLFFFLSIGSIFLGIYMMDFSIIFGIAFILIGIALLAIYSYRFIQNIKSIK